jgi:hypothetical protein
LNPNLAINFSFFTLAADDVCFTKLTPHYEQNGLKKSLRLVEGLTDKNEIVNIVPSYFKCECLENEIIYAFEKFVSKFETINFENKTVCIIKPNYRRKNIDDFLGFYIKK